MLEKPNLPDNLITSCLIDNYGIAVKALEFLPIGNDATAWVYKARADDDMAYLLKIKKGGVRAPTVMVPRLLKDEGIEAVVAPYPARDQMLWQRVDDFSLMLYPFVDGRSGGELGMSDNQWRQFGQILRRIHATRLSPDLLRQIQRETFVPKWAKLARSFQESIRRGRFNHTDHFASELADFWRTKRDEIEKIVIRTEELGRILQSKALDFVLCHADIHIFNIMLDLEGRLNIIDWDDALLAPKERDLMFVHDPDQKADGPSTSDLFFEGYGAAEIDLTAIAYYRYEWVVQEIGDYGERIFNSKDLGQETKADAVAEFQALFQPGDVVDGAYAADRWL